MEAAIAIEIAHQVAPPAISPRSQAWACFQSRLMVAWEQPETSALSWTVKPRRRWGQSWVRITEEVGRQDVAVWLVPTMGGIARPFLPKNSIQAV
jgi:hypothetical protein